MSLNKQQLEAVNQANFPDNNSKFITPELLREFNTDMIDAIQLTGSYATTGSNTFVGNQTITGDLNVSGVISASVLHVQTETASVIYSSGSNQLGDELTDIQTLSGSVKIQGQLLINGVPLSSGSATIDTGSLVTTASFNAYTQSTNLRLNSLETNSASVNVSISNLNTTTASLNTSITNLNSFSASQKTLNGTFATTGSNTFTGNQIIDRASKLYTNGVYWTDMTAGFNNLEIINQGGGNLDFASLNGGRMRVVNTPLVLTGSILSSNSDISTSANIYAANLTGSGVIPQGTISSSAQISALGFVSSSITGSSLITASAAGATITFTKGDNTQFSISVATGSFVSASYAETSSISRNVIVIARNGGASTLAAGTVVHITSAVGDNPIFTTASYDNEALSSNTFGLLRYSSPAGANVEVVVSGIVTGVNTDPVLGYTAGDIIYLSSSGQFTRVQPQAPNQIVTLGQVLRAQQNNGSIYVSINNGWELNELHNVQINNPLTGDLLQYESSSYGLWKNKSISGAGITSTSSFNAYTSSTNSRLTNIESTTASLNTSISNLNTFSASALSSISQLNASSASQQISINNLNTTTASLLIETQNLELFSASALVSISNLNQSSASQQVSINALNAATASYVTETESGSFLITASFDNGTRNLTFTKGNNTQFAVNIPDVSGSAGNFVTTSSFNSYTSSTNTRLNNIESTTASLLIETQNLELFSASALISINSLNGRTGSFATTGSNAFFGTNTFSGAVSFTGSAPSILSSSFSGSLITNLTDIYTDIPAVRQIVTLTSASYAGLVSGSLTNPNTLYIVSGSISGSGGGGTTDITQLNAFTASQYVSNSFFATTGSNTFIGAQQVVGPIQASDSNYGPQYVGPTLFQGVGSASVAYEQFVNAGNYDAIHIQSNLNAGTDFQDLPSDTFVLNTWLNIPTNTGNNPTPQFKRGLGITGSLDVSSTFTASLQQGYVWVGNSAGRTITVPTSSFAGGAPTGVITTGSATTNSQTILGDFKFDTTYTTSSAYTNQAGGAAILGIDYGDFNDILNYWGGLNFENITVNGTGVTNASITSYNFGSYLELNLSSGTTTNGASYTLSGPVYQTIDVTGSISATQELKVVKSDGSVQGVDRNGLYSRNASGTIQANLQASDGVNIGENVNFDYLRLLITGSQNGAGSEYDGAQIVMGANFTNRTQFGFQGTNNYTDGTITAYQPLFVSSSLRVKNAFTASLQQGYTWVGGAGNISTLVATSSFGSSINTGSFAILDANNIFTATNTFKGQTRYEGSGTSDSFSDVQFVNNQSLQTSVRSTLNSGQTGSFQIMSMTTGSGGNASFQMTAQISGSIGQLRVANQAGISNIGGFADTILFAKNEGFPNTPSTNFTVDSTNINLAGDVKVNKGSNKTSDIVTVGSGGLTVSSSLVTSNSIILATTQNANIAGVYPAVVGNKGTGTFSLSHNYSGNLQVAYLIINPI